MKMLQNVYLTGTFNANIGKTQPLSLNLQKGKISVELNKAG